MKLSSVVKNVYSQNGEDGIIEKIFEVIGTISRICIEFGAWDAALNRVAATNPSLVAVTETYCIFGSQSEASKFFGFETRIGLIKSDSQLLSLVTSYAGDYVVCGKPSYGISTPYCGKLFGESRNSPTALGFAASVCVFIDWCGSFLALRLKIA